MAHRPRSERLPKSSDDVARIEYALLENPKMSLRVASTELGSQISAIRNVLREELELLPYKMSF